MLQFSKDDMNTNLKTTVVVYNGEAEEQDKEQYNLLLTKLLLQSDKNPRKCFV